MVSFYTEILCEPFQHAFTFGCTKAMKLSYVRPFFPYLFNNVHEKTFAPPCIS